MNHKGSTALETGELFGNISVVKIDEDLEAVELGYVIGRRYWGCGYTAEAVKAVIAFLYLTFGEKGTGGWTSPDGTINCVEKAYDVNSEKFRVSLIRHEAQHAEDFRRWENIEPKDLEYRAKLVELIYTRETNLLAKFCSKANPERTDDGHALASARIKSEMGELICADIAEIQTRAGSLFAASAKEMDRLYGKKAGRLC